MAIIDLATTKTFLSLTDTSKDALITALIPIIEADYLKIRNTDFDTDDDGVTVYPDGASYTASQMIGYQLYKKIGVKSESFSGYSYQGEETIRGYPKTIVDAIDKYAGMQ